MRRAHRRRHGRSLGPQAITRPVGGGMFDVLLVDSKGHTLRTLARKVTRASALRWVG